MFKRTANKIVRNKKQDNAKANIKKLLQNYRAFSDKYARAFLDVVSTVDGMKYFSAVNYIKQIIIVCPYGREPGFHQSCFKRTVKNCDQRIIAIELAVIVRVLQYTFIKIDHS